MSTSSTWEGCGRRAPPGPRPSENTICSMDRMIRKRLRSTLSAMSPPTMGSTSVGPELGEDDDADERARVGEVVGVGAEDDVLHPGADVRGEGAQEDDAEGAVRQGRPGGAPAGRDGLSPSTTASSISSSEMASSSRSSGGLSGEGGTGPSYGRPSWPPAWSGAGGGADSPLRPGSPPGRQAGGVRSGRDSPVREPSHAAGTVGRHRRCGRLGHRRDGPTSGGGVCPGLENRTVPPRVVSGKRRDQRRHAVERSPHWTLGVGPDVAGRGADEQFVATGVRIATHGCPRPSSETRGRPTGRGRPVALRGRARP